MEESHQHHNHHHSHDEQKLHHHQNDHHHHQQQQQQQQHQRPPPHNSRLGNLRGGGGQVVEVAGGHIVRSTGRKDRHSKVCTAKGLRDRRVRLSAHTAIQFYDVQDRLGYDRPSKAVDWLIKHAKAAIDELAELPRWYPPTTTTYASSSNINNIPSPPPNQHDHDQPAVPNELPAGAEQEEEEEEEAAAAAAAAASASYSTPGNFFPPHHQVIVMDSDYSIADTMIKTFFPLPTTSTANSSSNYQNHQTPDLLSRSSSQAQDLRLSLQSFQHPAIFHQNQIPSPPTASSQQNFLPAYLAFDATSTSWPDQQQNQRINVAWNVAETSSGEGVGGYGFNMPPLQTPPLGQCQLPSQRGTLQSSILPSVRGWMDPIAAAAAAGHEIHPAGVLHPSALTTTGFVFSGDGGFSGFHIPARIQGEEEHGCIPSKPPSDSSASNQ